MKNIITIFIILMASLASQAVAQEDDALIDSLRQAYYRATDNTERATICRQIGYEAYSPDTVIKYTQMALQISDGLDLDGMAQCYSSLGWGYFINRDFAQALDKYQRAASLFVRLSKLSDASMVYTNIASCFRYMQNYKDMWDNLYRALDMAKKACDTANICYAYSEMADVYQNQKMGTIAQETLLKAFNLACASHNYAEMGVYAKQLGSIANPDELDIEGVKKAKEWADRAEGYFAKAESLDHYYEAIRYNNYALLIYCGLSLAKFYYDDRYIDSTKHYVEMYDDYASNISAVDDNKITALHIHARQLIYEQKYRKAIGLLLKCLNITEREKFGFLDNITYDLLAQSYEKIKDYKNALLYLTKYCDTEEKISGSDVVMQAVAYNARIKVEKEKRDIELENLMAQEQLEEAESRQRRTYAAIAATVFAAVSIIVIMFVSWLATRRAVKNIAARNVKILKQQLQIDDQKTELQETSQKIYQSMTYARRIQMAATSSQNELAAVFPHSLVIYRPQEIVSGDWYLVKQIGGRRYLAVGGSSEHGVPGAMACMLVVDSLKEVVGKMSSEAKMSPSEILAQVETKAKSTFGAGVEIAISLCIIDEDNMLNFSAINNDAVLVHDGTATTLVSSKRESLVQQLVEGDYLFLYSNNTRRLMLSTDNTPETLCNLLARQYAEDSQVAIDTITGGKPQTGDITIVGTRV
jgi:tetratricopeptide (TPR) repeat protein